jgi:hypothetical protein
MIIIAFRPRQGELSWSFHEMAGRKYGSRYQTNFLDPLDEGQARELVASLLHVEGLPEHVRIEWGFFKEA